MLQPQPLAEEAVSGAVQPWSQEASWPQEGAGLAHQQHASWEGGQWAPEQAYGQWQWQGGTPAEGWAAPVDVHWQGGTQVDPAGHPSACHPSAAPPAEPSLYPAPPHQGLQDQDGWEAAVEDAVVSSTPPAPECPQDCSQAFVEHPEASAGDDGTVSMFFQDGASSDSREPMPQVAEYLSTSTGFAVDALLDGKEGSIEMSPAAAHEVVAPLPPGSDEPVNQEVLPEPLPLAAEPREALLPPSQEEGPPPECSAPAPSKKAVIRARQGGAFKPPVRQGSTTDSALQQQNGGPPENLELLPPDGRPSLRRAGVAPLSLPAGTVDSVGAALTLLDAPDMQPLVTLAPAAPPIDRLPPSRAVRPCPCCARARWAGRGRWPATCLPGRRQPPCWHPAHRCWILHCQRGPSPRGAPTGRSLP